MKDIVSPRPAASASAQSASLLDPQDLYLFAEGTHERAWQFLGAHLRTVDGADGVLFAVWAPNAVAVSVVGDFNAWDATAHGMRSWGSSGVWECFVPGLTAGSRYKFALRARDGRPLPFKADPYARAMEPPGRTASVVAADSGFRWSDEAWMRSRGSRNGRDAPISIYEVHLGSWRRHTDGNRYLGYRELADQLVPYARDMGFTHLQLLPVSEHPFDGSWGYQPLGLFAPSCRFGSADDLRWLIDRCHAEGIGVLLDWVPAHFPTDEHGLARFDGTALYEHEDPRRGFHLDWNTLIYNLGRHEVISFLLSNAHYWLEEFHVDGLRVDAVASMLYLDYSRRPGEWLPNPHGGNENLEAVALLREVNRRLYANFPEAMTVAEESTAWPGVSLPVHHGGLGFGFKWNMGWMHDSLRYMARDPAHRPFHHNELSFALMYAFSENYVLPLSHDEVVHGKRSLLGRMPGDEWQRFANLRAFYGYMWTHPGKKLLFMGGEFGQSTEWDHDRGLDWGALESDSHAGVQRLVRDLNTLYREQAALYALDCEAAGFEWIDCHDATHSVVLFRRLAGAADRELIVACNFTPVPRHGWRIGVPLAGSWAERLNTDAALYGGSNTGNAGGVPSEPVAAHGHEQSIVVTLPPLATVVFISPAKGEMP